MLGLSYMLSMGMGAEKDRVEAYKWLLIAEQSPWAAEHPDVQKAIQSGSADLRHQLDEAEAGEARECALAWSPQQ